MLLGAGVTAFIQSSSATTVMGIADHCSNIAACVIGVNHEDVDIHEYLRTMKKVNNEKFKEYFASYTEKYALPR